MTDIKHFDIASCVTDALIDVFDMMLSMQLQLSDDDSRSISDVERIVGSVNLAGKVMGSINIQVTEDFSRRMAGCMLDTDIEAVDGTEDVKDVISEVCNIVGGNLKSNFCDSGLACELSPPSFTSGTDFKRESLNTERHERFVFQCEEDVVIVEVGVRISEGEVTIGEGSSGSKELQPVNVEDLRNFDITSAVTRAVTEVFDTMLGMELAAYEEEMKSGLEGERIVGSVGFVGPLMGEMNLYVSDDFSRAVTAGMMDMDKEEVQGEESVKDVIGEICNIVGGGLKSEFSDAGLICDLSTPSFTSGSDFRIESQKMTRYERLGFRHDEEILFIEIGLKALDPSQEENNGEADATSRYKNGALDPQRAIDAMIASKETVQDVPEEPPAEPGKEPAQEPQEPPSGMDLNEHNLQMILGIPLEVTVELGRTRKSIHEMLEVGQGSVIQFPNLAGEPVDILVNQKLIASGEVVVENEKYGVRILETVGPVDRIKSLS